MLDEQSAATAVADWAGEVCGIDEARRFAYPQAAKTAELPDVAASLVSSRTQQGADEVDFPLAAVQQSWLAIFVVQFSIMVEQGADEASAASAQAELYGYAAQLRDALLGDVTLGDRLDADAGQFASPVIEFDFSAPFVEYEDGTRGRVTPGTVRLAQAIPEPA